MKIRLLLTLAGLAIAFALPTFAQQTNTPDPKLREQFIEGGKKFDDAFVKGDAAFLASCYTDDAVQVNDSGPLYGREAIEKNFENVFNAVHFSKHIGTLDQYSPRIIGTAGNVMFATGDWSTTVQGKTSQGQNFGPLDEKGYWTCLYVREGDAGKNSLTAITPAPPEPAQTK